MKDIKFYAVRVKGTEDYYKPNPHWISDDKGTIESFDEKALNAPHDWFPPKYPVYYTACKEYPQLTFEVVDLILKEVTKKE